MQIIKTITDIREVIKTWQAAGETVAFVPTMGNLHAGHLQLVRRAKENANRVVVSIFVNPTQFGVGEDFEAYPRTELEDQEKLKKEGADLLFLPSVIDVYSSEANTNITVAGLSEAYCGAFRPGHFSGVATVVCKLFNIVQPNVALFGRKDFQQLTIIKMMVRDLNIPVEIIGVDTVRDPSGLAMSSRNGYLTEDEKKVASMIYYALGIAREAILAGNENFADIEKKAMQSLSQIGFQPDYFSVCRASDLKKATIEDVNLVLLVAAKLGKTRLIDNLCFSR